MVKEEIFSKLNIKDYNNKLEKIIEKKSFSEDTKNLLLNMFYKIELAYDDYSKIKTNINFKKEILEEILNIIENDCDKIELIKPKIDKETILKDKKNIVIKEDKKIISYPNEKDILDALYTIQKSKFNIKNKYTIVKKSLEMLLNLGNKINKTEIIRDFDGWAWNININEIEDININIVYQNIQMLVGHQFLKDWLENVNNDDYLLQLKQILEKLYEQETGWNLYKTICQISILIFVKNNNQEKNRLISQKEILKKEIETIEDKKNYLQELNNSKKEIAKKIKKIDETINNKVQMQKEFANRNKLLSKEKKIFSLSDFYEIMLQERKTLILELKLNSNLMDPIKYFKTKEELIKKFNLINELNLEKIKSDKENEFIIKFQKYFLIAIKQKIKKSNTKKEIIDMIYQMRYYLILPIKQIADKEQVQELLKDINSTNKLLITKACKQKVLNILSNNINENFKIISKILNTKIVNLEEIIIEIKKKDENILLNIYEENIIDKSIEQIKIEDPNIKYNKKIKLFI